MARVEEVDRQAVVLGQGGLVALLLPSSATSAVCWISKLSSRVCFPVHGQVGSSPAGCHLARPLQEFVGWPLGSAHQFLKQASVSHSKLGMMGQNPSPSQYILITSLVRDVAIIVPIFRMGKLKLRSRKEVSQCCHEELEMGLVR